MRRQGLIRKNFAFAAEALRLEHLFITKNIPVAFIKGSSLAMLAYGNVGIRHNRDIDIVAGF